MSNPKLLDEYPLIVLPSLARAVGLNEAVVLQQIHFYISTHQKLGSKNTHFRDGRWWCWRALSEWQDIFPFWGLSTIRRTLASLRDKGLVFAEKHGTDPTDHTLWYSVDYGSLNSLLGDDPRGPAPRSVQNEHIDMSESTNRSVQNEHIDMSESTNRSVQNEHIDMFRMDTSPYIETTTTTTTNAREMAQALKTTTPHPQTGEPIGWEEIQSLEIPEHFIRALADYLDVAISSGTEIVVYAEALRVLKTDEQARRYLAWKMADLSSGSKDGGRYHSRAVMRALREDAPRWLEDQKSAGGKLKTRGDVRKTSFWESDSAQKALGPPQVDYDYDPTL